MAADPARDHARRGLRFVIVGAAAAATHYVVGLFAYSVLGLGPGVSNAIGYACGFPVSYAGQRSWTFGETREPHRVALPRYAMVQLGSFLVNQALLLLAVRFLPLPFWFILGAVLVIVAMLTYVTSKVWVFRA